MYRVKKRKKTNNCPTTTTTASADNDKEKGVGCSKQPMKKNHNDNDETKSTRSSSSSSSRTISEDEYKHNLTTKHNADDDSISTCSSSDDNLPPCSPRPPVPSITKTYKFQSSQPLGIIASDKYDDPTISCPYWYISKVNDGMQGHKLGVRLYQKIFGIGGQVVTTNDDLFEILADIKKEYGERGGEIEVVMSIPEDEDEVDEDEVDEDEEEEVVGVMNTPKSHDIIPPQQKLQEEDEDVGSMNKKPLEISKQRTQQNEKSLEIPQQREEEEEDENVDVMSTQKPHEMMSPQHKQPHEEEREEVDVMRNEKSLEIPQPQKYQDEEDKEVDVMSNEKPLEMPQQKQREEGEVEEDKEVDVMNTQKPHEIPQKQQAQLDGEEEGAVDVMINEKPNEIPQKQQQEKGEEEDERIVVIPKSNLKLKQKPFSKIRQQCFTYIQAVVKDYYLLPTSQHAQNACDYVFASLCNDSPSSSSTEQEWFHGNQRLLQGPQPWMLTRKYIIDKLSSYLQEKGQDDWMTCSQRMECVQTKLLSTINKYLKTWVSSSSTETEYAQGIYKRFLHHHNYPKYPILHFHRLTETYVHIVANVLQRKQISSSTSTNVMPVKKDVSQEVLERIEACVKEIWDDILPLCKNDASIIQKAIVQRLSSIYVTPISIDIIKSEFLWEILQDLEIDMNFLTNQNACFKVCVKLSSMNTTSLALKSPRMEEVVEEAGGPAVVEDEFQEDITSALLEQEEQKSVGTRVYAEFSNRKYYWGRIAQIFEHKPTTATAVTSKYYYKVLFEDGDVLDEVNENKILTEYEYKQIFNENPPLPTSPLRPEIASTNRSRKRRKNRERYSSMGSSSSKRLRGKKRLAKSILSTSNDLKRKKKKLLDPKNQENEEGTQVITSDINNDIDKKTMIRKDLITPDSITETLAIKGCNQCNQCKKPDCGQCFTCLQKHKRGCLQKMCSNIPIEQKSQPAVGLPLGWTFHIPHSNPKPTHRSCQSPVQIIPQNILLVSPNRRQTYTSIESAILDNYPDYILEMYTMSHTFYTHVGLVPPSQTVTSVSHFLLGKGYCHEWTSKDHYTQVLFGTITHCFKNDQSQRVFVVEYTESSISLFSSLAEDDERYDIPKRQCISLDMAWGGCITFEQKVKLRDEDVVARKRNISSKPIPCTTWVVPDRVREELVPWKNDLKLPRLTVILRGYRLVFTAKSSSITASKYSLFVKCKSLVHNPNNAPNKTRSALKALNLKPGQLIDLGIFSPLHPKNKKHDCIFRLKNYIHSRGCEEWSYRAMDGEHILDITDEVTGDVHDFARKHALMYVNECCSGSSTMPWIHAQYSPDGSVHYLFGITYQDGEYEKQVDFNVGGEEIELFINHGEDYERVRVRNEHQPEKNKNSNEENFDDSIDQVIDEFNAKELMMSLSYFSNQFISEEKVTLNEKVFERALKVAHCMKHRIRDLISLKQMKKNEPCSPSSLYAYLLKLATNFVNQLKHLSDDTNNGTEVHEKDAKKQHDFEDSDDKDDELQSDAESTESKVVKEV